MQRIAGVALLLAGNLVMAMMEPAWLSAIGLLPAAAGVVLLMLAARPR